MTSCCAVERMSRRHSLVLWLAGQEAKPAEVQKEEAAAAVKVQAIMRGRNQRQGTGPSGSVPKAMGGCRGSGGPAQLAMRAAAAQRKEERKAAQSLLGDFVLDTTPEALTPAQQLAKILKKDGARVMDLFRSWDADSSGKVDRKEFRKAIAMLGLTGVSRDEVDDLFDGWGGGDGSIDFKELAALLRNKPPPQHRPASAAPTLVQVGPGGSWVESPRDNPPYYTGRGRPYSAMGSHRPRPLSAAGMPFEVHPEYHKSMSLKGPRPMTASMARAKKGFEHQVAAEGRLSSHNPSFVSSWKKPPAPYVPSPAEWQSLTPRPLSAAQPYSTPYGPPPPVDFEASGGVGELHCARTPKPVMLSTRPASARGSGSYDHFLDAPRPSSPRMRVQKDAHFYYPAPVCPSRPNPKPNPNNPDPNPHPDPNPDSNPNPNQAPEEWQLQSLGLGARSPRAVEQGNAGLPMGAGDFALDYSAILSHKGVISSPRPGSSASPRRQGSAQRSRPRPAAPQPRASPVRWPQQPAPKVSSRPRGPRTRPAKVDGATAYGRPFTTYFLINA